MVQSHSFWESISNFELLDNHFQGLIAVDLEGKIIVCNRFFEKLLSTPSSELLGRKIQTVIPEAKLLDTIAQQCSTWGEVLQVHGKELVVVRYPIKVNHEIKGAVLKTLFPDMNLAKEVSARFLNINETHYGAGRLHTCMDIIGESEPMLLVKKLARRASRSTSNLLITGESGTGKSIIAEAIHNRSVRRDKPFVKVNCAAIPESLLESELFGYEEGSFTGAKKKGKAGKFELADSGTLFLDEIGDMPLHMQAKLLQAIQDKRIERVGGIKPIDLDVRVIAATNKDLLQMIRTQQFREDLFYRLKVLEIRMPALRERTEDIPQYITGLLSGINRKLGSDAIGFTQSSLDTLMRYPWPGNVRQLENFLEQAVNYSDESLIDLDHLEIKPWHQNELIQTQAYTAPTAATDSTSVSMPLIEAVSTTERELIIETIKQCHGNKSKAAEMLNIQRSVLYKKIKRLNIVV